MPEHDRTCRQRTGEHIPPSAVGKPRITVITVVLNGCEALKKTILSVTGQTYKNMEYIVIDGGSTDGTLEVIRKHENDIDYWLSEPDKGIYDAMNKGISLASGEWIIFMNAGDCFYQPETLETLFHKGNSEADLVYGNWSVNYRGEFTRIQKAGDYDEIWKGMALCHQSLLMKTALLKLRPFNIQNRICADFEVIFACFLEGRTFIKLDQVIATIEAEGVSDINRKEVMLKKWSIVRKHDNSLTVNAFFIFTLIDAAIRILLKAILPRKLQILLLKLK